MKGLPGPDAAEGNTPDTSVLPVENRGKSHPPLTPNGGDLRGNPSAPIVTPAKAGVQCIPENLDSCFRRNDDKSVFTQGRVLKSQALPFTPPIKRGEWQALFPCGRGKGEGEFGHFNNTANFKERHDFTRIPDAGGVGQ